MNPGTQHPSSLRLEAHAFGPDDQQSDIGQHILACPACRGQVEKLRQEREAFLLQRPASVFAAGLRERAGVATSKPRGLRWHWLVASAAAVCLLVLFLAGRKEDGIQLKASPEPSLTLFASRGGGSAVPHDPSRSLQKGDVIRFAVAVPQDGYVFVANIDDRGRFTRYYPQQDSRAAPVSRTDHLLLPGSIELDDFVGQELLVAFFSKARLTESEIKRSLEAAFKQAGDLDSIGRLGLDARTARIKIRKAEVP